jgi:hypothetical protein
MKFQHMKSEPMKIHTMKIRVSRFVFANMRGMFQHFKLKEDRDA